MMETTTNLNLPYIMPSQAQKHVTHNEALRMLDALVQLSVLSRAITVPPASPDEGARYLVPAGASGLWAGKVGAVAAYIDQEWFFFNPVTGWLMHIIDENMLLIFNGNAWQALLNPQPFIGVNTSADHYNRLAVASDAVLLSHNGAGHQLKLNKNQASDTASLLFQSNWSGHAEMGLNGENHFSIKVSNDGQQWQQALRVDGASGHIAIGTIWPTAPLHVAGAIRPGNYTAATLPSAGQLGAGALICVGTSGKLAYSNGTNWLWVENNALVTA